MLLPFNWFSGSILISKADSVPGFSPDARSIRIESDLPGAREKIWLVFGEKREGQEIWVGG